jgi:hypothetical protein
MPGRIAINPKEFTRTHSAQQGKKDTNRKPGIFILHLVIHRKSRTRVSETPTYYNTNRSFYSTFQKSLPNEMRYRLLEKTISRRSLGEGGFFQ